MLWYRASPPPVQRACSEIAMAMPISASFDMKTTGKPLENHLGSIAMTESTARK